MEDRKTVYCRVQPYLCLIVSLYLLCCLAHDIWVYRQIQVQEMFEIRKEEKISQEALKRLDALIHIAEENEIDEETKQRLITLRRKLNNRP